MSRLASRQAGPRSNIEKQPPGRRQRKLRIRNCSVRRGIMFVSLVTFNDSGRLRIRTFCKQLEIAARVHAQEHICNEVKARRRSRLAGPHEQRPQPKVVRLRWRQARNNSCCPETVQSHGEGAPTHSREPAGPPIQSSILLLPLALQASLPHIVAKPFGGRPERQTCSNNFRAQIEFGRQPFTTMTFAAMWAVEQRLGQRSARRLYVRGRCRARPSGGDQLVALPNAARDQLSHALWQTVPHVLTHSV